MSDQPIKLDRHRGATAQRAIEIRRLVGEVEAAEESLRRRREELESRLLVTPAATWAEAAVKAKYLLTLLASSPIANDPSRQVLIAKVLQDFEVLSHGDGTVPTD